MNSPSTDPPWDAKAWRAWLTQVVRAMEAQVQGGTVYLAQPPDGELPPPVNPSSTGPADRPDAGSLEASRRAALSSLGRAADRDPRARQTSSAAKEQANKGRGGQGQASDTAGRAQPSDHGLHDVTSLEALRERFAACTMCGLCATRQQVVFGVGNSERPRLLFLGEGPGADEDRLGEPFVGRAGKLLSGLIFALGLVRADVYITNVVKCRPPDNRNPHADEQAACRPILERQLELLDPSLIITLGNVPTQALNPRVKGITAVRGLLSDYRGWRVLPTFHPSYLLRNAAAIPLCWQDLKYAMELAYPESG